MSNILLQTTSLSDLRPKSFYTAVTSLSKEVTQEPASIRHIFHVKWGIITAAWLLRTFLCVHAWHSPIHHYFTEPVQRPFAVHHDGTGSRPNLSSPEVRWITPQWPKLSICVRFLFRLCLMFMIYKCCRRLHHHNSCVTSVSSTITIVSSSVKQRYLWNFCRQLKRARNEKYV